MTSGVDVIIVSLLTLAIAQAIKCGLSWAKRGTFTINVFFEDGQMPSGHSATLTVLATGIFLVDGFSLTFAVALFLALFVIHDALHIRNEVGRHAEYLNKAKGKHLFKESTGHSPLEVFLGMLLGFLVTGAYFLFL
jgi:uncharacterized protein